MFAETRFDLSPLPNFTGTGFFPEPEAPAYLPSPTDEAWRLGYDLERDGELAMVRTIDGFGPDEQLAFARGQRAAREQRAAVPAIPVRMTPDELAEGLRIMAAWCEGQGGQLGAMASHLLRQGSKDVSYYRADNPKDFEARDAAMIETLQDCPECRARAYADRM